jgi:hypothetical protein
MRIKPITEERDAQRFPAPEVLDSYWFRKDGRSKRLNIMNMDPHGPSIKTDRERGSQGKTILWLASPIKGKHISLVVVLPGVAVIGGLRIQHQGDEVVSRDLVDVLYQANLLDPANRIVHPHPGVQDHFSLGLQPLVDLNVIGIW